ncbi:RNA-directed DNA polymerase, eukaryota [Tanacetum coccineum]
MAASTQRSSFQSKEDQTRKISHSIFVTNFPDSVNSRELWRVCSVYGMVVDVFIPSKKSMAGKRFAFVRFIKVPNVDRLVENLCTLWIGHHHLYANKVRYERPSKPHPIPAAYHGSENTFNSSGSHCTNARARSYANIVNGASVGVNITQPPALVLDDSCLVEHDLSKHVMGKLKDFSSFPNLSTLLLDEGFSDVHLSYLGGMWVMLEFETEDIKKNLMVHTGINSWFDVIQDAETDFVSDERIVWVDIEGVPLKAWSRETFTRIAKKWGEMLELEDNADNSFGRKRICIKTKNPVSILESFKIIVKGKIFMVRAKELFTWNPSFVVSKERVYNSEDESVHDASHPNEAASDNGSDDDEVADTIFGNNKASGSKLHPNGEGDKQKSDDPFEIYDLLKKQDLGENREPSPSLSHPPGFSMNHDGIPNNIGDSNSNANKEPSASFTAKVMNISQEVPEESNGEFVGQQNPMPNGGSVLGVLDDIIKLGLGHKTKKEWVKELAFKYKLNFLAIQETKMSSVSLMDVKFMWGNSNFDYVCSGSLGASGGILCMWEASMFKKDNATISDNFVALYGTWLPTNSKIMFVVVYAPQQAACKMVLWDYLSILLNRWVGDTIMMGDFNEVRSIDERRGSIFNPNSARRFDQFISSSGLVDVKLEGYSFTWSHPSASKMSKLDRFLVSQGILLSFPSLTALCLDRHLSDHRPILLKEVHLDFGPIPFRFYHSWMDMVGFDDMIKCTWKSFSHVDENRLIRFKKKLQDLKVIIRYWINEKRRASSLLKSDLISELGKIDKDLDRGSITDDQILRRVELKRKLIDINGTEAKDNLQRSKLKWAAEASILVNGSPSKEFSFHCGLKQGDPLAPYLFILVMESLHLSFLRVVDEGLFKGVQLSESVSISHLFYADDAMFIGDWSEGNLATILKTLKCFHLASGLQINILKSQILGVGVPRLAVEQVASYIGCSVMNNQFKYLGVQVGEHMSRHKAWDDTINKLTSRLSKWKANTLSIGGRLTLLKSVLGATPIYSMSIFKVPKGILKAMEALRNRFFIGADVSDRKMTWAAWDKVLASKKNGGLDGSLWYRVICALYGDFISSHSSHVSSNWSSILRELYELRDKGFDFWSHCKRRIGDGVDTRFWLDCWIGDTPPHILFPRLFALEQNKNISVASKLNVSLEQSFRRDVRDGAELQQMTDLKAKLEMISLSNVRDRWRCDLTDDGEFRVKEVRNFIDDLFLPSFDATRWVKCVPIKINIFCLEGSS